jgi:hypothetical protein
MSNKLTECDVGNCPGLLEEASQSCVICLADEGSSLSLIIINEEANKRLKPITISEGSSLIIINEEAQSTKRLKPLILLLESMKAQASLLLMIINEEARASYFIIKMIAGSSLLVEKKYGCGNLKLGKLVKTGWLARVSKMSFELLILV